MDDTSVSIAAVLLRVIVGITIFAHGWNHVWGGGRIAGTARWFGSIGFRAPRLQAWLASVNELVAGPLLIAGLVTPFAAAAVVGTMLVALVANHFKNGFFIFRQGEGYEYVLMVAVVSVAIGALGGGKWSIDHLAGIDIDGWTGALVAAGGGVGGLGVLAAFWRRPVRT